METAFEEETFHKIIYIILAILCIILIIVILDVMTGGTLFGSIVCMMVWYLPITGPTLTPYLCSGVPI
jgi:hypothetical protein